MWGGDIHIRPQCRICEPRSRIRNWKSELKSEIGIEFGNRNRNPNLGSSLGIGFCASACALRKSPCGTHFITLKRDLRNASPRDRISEPGRDASPLRGSRVRVTAPGGLALWPPLASPGGAPPPLRPSCPPRSPRPPLRGSLRALSARALLRAPGGVHGHFGPLRRGLYFVSLVS